MFEISVAFKYLLPRKKQLSVSLISLMSVLVISLVVWLVLLFLSITDGIEKKWLEKLTNLNAPLRLTPTEEYYSSYYYQIDTLSSASDFQTRSIQQKLNSPFSDPYSPQEDEQIPRNFPEADRDAHNRLKDPVKAAFRILNDLQKNDRSVAFQDFEMGGALLRLQLFGNNRTNLSPQFLTQACYVASFPDRSPYIQNLLLPVRNADINHLCFLSSLSPDGTLEDEPASFTRSSLEKTQIRLETLLKHATVKSLKTLGPYWKIPPEILPSTGKLKAQAYIRNGQILRIFIKNEKADEKRDGKNIVDGTLILEKGNPVFLPSQGKIENHPLELKTPIFVEGPLTFQGTLVPESLYEKPLNNISLNGIQGVERLRFSIQTHLQGIPIHGEVPFEGLEIAEAAIKSRFETRSLATCPWISYITQENRAHLPTTSEKQVGVLLAKNFQDIGVFIGDRGYLSYGSSTVTSVQEQRLPIFVAGFYDPGVLPVGAKCILAPPEISHIIHSSSNSFHLDKTQSNGILVWFKDLNAASAYKEKILSKLKEAKIEQYWKVSTFHEYDFAKDLFQQFQSDQYLFTLVGIIILIVACCNIISLLVLLVNDKKREIGILQSMGASNKSIAIIFGTCGITMGLLGTLIGTGAAVLTLHYIDGIVHLLSLLQGHNPFNAAFFGASLPNTLSDKAFIFIAIATPLLSLCAGLIPAIKACRLKPSAILRSE